MLYDENGVKLSDAEEKAFMDQWAIDGRDKPRTKTYKDGHKILSLVEISEFETEWAANKAESDEINRVTGIKTEAGKRIIALLPPSNEPNFLIRENDLQARMSYLQRKEYKGTVTLDETAELDAGEALWLKIEQIRALEGSATTLEQFIIDLDLL